MNMVTMPNARPCSLGSRASGIMASAAVHVKIKIGSVFVDATQIGGIEAVDNGVKRTPRSNHNRI
jgi:hypothetical protein